MTVESFYIIRVFQPIVLGKIADARLERGRWTIRYKGNRDYQDLSGELCLKMN